jgi:hypothetical protein
MLLPLNLDKKLTNTSQKALPGFRNLNFGVPISRGPLEVAFILPYLNSALVKLAYAKIKFPDLA